MSLSNIEKNYIKTFEDEDFIEYVEDYDEYEMGIEKYGILFDNAISEIKSLANMGSKGVKVYRAINLKSLEDLDTSNVGQSWTYSKEHAHGWYGGDGESYILCAEMPVNSIDYWRSVRQNIITPEEREFGLEPGEPIYLTDVLDQEGNKIESFDYLQSTTEEGNFGEWTGD